MEGLNVGTLEGAEDGDPGLVGCEDGCSVRVGCEDGLDDGTWVVVIDVG